MQQHINREGSVSRLGGIIVTQYETGLHVTRHSGERDKMRWLIRQWLYGSGPLGCDAPIGADEGAGL